MNLVFAYAEAGRSTDAEQAAVEVRRLAPEFSTERYRRVERYQYPADWERFAGALNAFGIP